MPTKHNEVNTKSLPWFRFYAEALDDPKCDRLPGDVYKVWVKLLCIACKRGGTLPGRDELAYMLRMSDNDASAALDRLIDVGLVDIAPDRSLQPHNWEGRQFRSDSSTDRVRKHRQKQRQPLPKHDCNVSVTPPDTDTDTDTELETTTVEPLNAVQPAKKASKGSRLDLEWQLPAEWLMWSQTNFPAATVEQIQDQAAQFRDYWIATPGAKACKLDWEATWRNWCRRGLSQAGMRRPQSTGVYHAKPKLDWDEVMREATKLAEGYA